MNLHDLSLGQIGDRINQTCGVPAETPPLGEVSFDSLEARKTRLITELKNNELLLFDPERLWVFLYLTAEQRLQRPILQRPEHQNGNGHGKQIGEPTESEEFVLTYLERGKQFGEDLRRLLPKAEEEWLLLKAESRALQRSGGDYAALEEKAARIHLSDQSNSEVLQALPTAAVLLPI